MFLGVYKRVYKRNGEKDKIFLLNKEVTLAKAKATDSITSHGLPTKEGEEKAIFDYEKIL